MTASPDQTESSLEPDRGGPTPANMVAQAQRAADFLKAMSHEARLMILCHLADGEKSVGELVALLSMRQAAVSQQLARLRGDGLVKTRREGKTVYYALADGKAQRLVALLYDMFCAEAASPRGDGTP